MPSRHRGGKATLSQGLDKEVYQAVGKLQNDGKISGRLSVATVYQEIKRSNSSLNRKSKRLLEDSIERVLDVKGDEADGDDSTASIDGDYEGLVDPEAAQEETNSVNRSIVNMWSTPKQVESTPQPLGEATASQKNTDRQANGEPPRKRRKAVASQAVDRSPPSHVSLADLGGADSVIQQLEDLIVLPLLRPQTYIDSKIQPPRGVLLHGPPGCGKTMIANAFAAELGIPFIPISAPSIVSGMSGESEKQLREYFEEAKKMAPCLVFIDEIDAITPKRDGAQREMEKRIVAQMLISMDDLALEKTDGKAVIVLAATNRPDSLDPALRRGGRFDKEINLSVPNEAVREQILRTLTRQMQLGDVKFKALAKATPGFVGADLNDLVSTAGSAAIKRYLEDIKRIAAETSGRAIDEDGRKVADTNEMDLDASPQDSGITPRVKELRELVQWAKKTSISEQEEIIKITNEDFLTALPKIQPSSKREGFATIPDTTWADIGALRSVRDELQTAIVEPIKSPEKYERVGITPPTGVLLWGPPGCGKTLLAKAVANESRANFISVKGPELLNKYVGESERAVRQVFVRARSSIPCVIFFDELDALVPKREDSQSEASARVVNTLLTELDGLDNRAGIFVIAATNRPDIIDPAMLRPGRLETLLYVDLPGPRERAEILQTLTRKLPGMQSGLFKVAERCEGFSGADLESLLRQAGISAIGRGSLIEIEDFERALGKIRPSVGDMRKYERLKGKLGQGGVL
ncbi:MAG: hypothetical protein M1827_005416 [Pycnora praestabilis]|nr:MAG: hypothetical protein M1827_005416 [Pycnora praestabilis]